MKKIFFVLGMLFCWTFTSNGQSVRKFEFTITWGTGADNLYNSKTGEFQKDLVGDVYKGKMGLTKREKKSILKKVNEINFWNIPKTYTGTRPAPVNGIHKSVSIQPCTYYSISISLNGKTHSVSWTCESIDMGEKGSYNDLTSLRNHIGTIINSHKEWKNSPPARGAYY